MSDVEGATETVLKDRIDGREGWTFRYAGVASFAGRGFSLSPRRRWRRRRTKYHVRRPVRRSRKKQVSERPTMIAVRLGLVSVECEVEAFGDEEGFTSAPADVLTPVA